MKHPHIDPEINSSIGPAKKLMVLLHGVGADGHNLIGIAAYMKHDLPDSHFFAPHGVEPYDHAPTGRQWFSLPDLTSVENMQQLLEKNSEAIAALIKKKQTTLGLSNQDTIILGFSQGAMVALYLTLTQREPFLCTLSFSGLLLPPRQCINKATPICLIHGVLDPVIAADALDNAIHYLQKFHIPYQAHKLPNLTHAIDERGLKHALDFVKVHLKPNQLLE